MVECVMLRWMFQVRNMFFEDGKRRIDFILAWNVKHSKKQEEAEKARELFENNLRLEGLELEYDRVNSGLLMLLLLIM